MVDFTTEDKGPGTHTLCTVLSSLCTLIFVEILEYVVWVFCSLVPWTPPNEARVCGYGCERCRLEVSSHGYNKAMGCII